MGNRHNKNGFRQVYVTCPFFKNYTPISVACEGFMDGVKLTSTFSSPDDLRVHMDTFCCDHNDYCEVYRMVMEAKYEEDD